MPAVQLPYTCLLVLLPDQRLWFLVWERDCVRMCKTFKNGVLCNRQQPGSAVNSFIDQGEFRAMKTLSGQIALGCDKDQFCDKMTVST